MGAGFSGIAMGMALRRDGDRRLHDLRAGHRTWAACGRPTTTPAPRATCRRTCTPTRTSSGATGRARARPSRRSWTTCTRPRPSTAVDEKIVMNTEIASAEFDAAAKRWRLRTVAGDEHEAEALVVACGQLSRPNWPDIPGRRRVRRPLLPLRRVGPRLRPGRQAGGGGGHRRQRRAVRAAGGRGGRAPGRVPALGAVDAAPHQRGVPALGPVAAAPRSRPAGAAPPLRADDDGVDHPGVRRRAAAALGAERVLAGVHAPPAARPRTPAASCGPTTRWAASACCSAATTCPRCSATTWTW